MAQPSSSFRDSKKHYEILDGLRGVAAIMVVLFHILEAFALGNPAGQIINHGYLAVDFFFILSGFVIGYAYDDRWLKMSLGDFFKRRLIRLHPMIIVGMLIGAATFYFQDSQLFPGIHDVPFGTFILVTIISLTLIPLPLSMDIRGWGEMHPLNGPAWSLFFEYVANILYALILRRLSNSILAVLLFIAGAALIHLAVTSEHGHLVGGWSLDPAQFRIGFTRLMYPFLAGLLLSRVMKPGQINHAFLWCFLLLVTTLSIPNLGTGDKSWINGLYDSLCVVFIFPLIIYIGASGGVTGYYSKVNKFLADISYPIYIIHYPFIYLFMGWVADHHMTPSGPSYGPVIAMGVALLLGTVLLAYLIVKLYDEPVRNWLSRKLHPALTGK